MSTVLTVDEGARWREIEKLSSNIAYSDPMPSPTESALCGAVTRAKDALEALQVAHAELENHTSTPGVSEHVLPCIRRALARFGVER